MGGDPKDITDDTPLGELNQIFMNANVDDLVVVGDAIQAIAKGEAGLGPHLMELHNNYLAAAIGEMITQLAENRG